MSKLDILGVLYDQQRCMPKSGSSYTKVQVYNMQVTKMTILFSYLSQTFAVEWDEPHLDEYISLQCIQKRLRWLASIQTQTLQMYTQVWT